jgi:hypothetical protein
MSMRNSIAHIIINDHDQHISAASMADAILAALPDMIAPLVWEDYPMGSRCKTNDDYSINYWEPEGVFVDAYTTMRRHPTLEAAQAAANTHHRAAIMAAFTGETQ